MLSVILAVFVNNRHNCGSRRRGAIVRGGGRESVADLLRHSLTAKGGNEGCWSGCLGRSTAENQTDRRASTASFIDPGTGTAAGTGHHRPGSSASAQNIHPVLIAPPYIGLGQMVTGDCCRFFSHFLQGVHSVDGWTEWTRWTVVDESGQRFPFRLQINRTYW